MTRHTFTRFTPTGLISDDETTSSTSVILTEAEKLGVSFRSLPGTKVLELTYEGQIQYFKAQVPFQTSFIGHYLASDKAASKAVMLSNKLSVSTGYAIFPTDPQTYWIEVFNSLTKPLVVKPSNMNKGSNVTINIQDVSTFTSVVKECLLLLTGDEASVIVEEMFVGEEYRILATPKKVLGIINRRPANVVGNGHATIQQLIDQKNADPRRSDDPNDSLVKTKITEHVITYLAEQGLTLNSAPADGERVWLRRNSNISTGGDSIDVTDTAHPSVSAIALQTMAAFPGLALGGIDFMTKDITQPQTADSYVIIEVNSSPGIDVHDNPAEGKNRHAAREFLSILFPKLRTKNQESNS